MTHEEAINTLKSLKDYYNCKDECGHVEFDDEDNEALDMAIKALEQDSILDKIRAEIEEQADRFKDNLFGGGMRHCIEIIDKYKSESEGKDNAESEVEVYSSNFIQLKQDVLKNKQLWRKLREIEDE